ncbi:facilitated trehalose transporter Tret1-like [Aricia agestis]|uniref:facilitated trehalose transporter Tret1-like n=1 Tax=Aricia agestis TaxID=91739 RepID=UPI001C206F33|nr:facilitated trehalose transporter Tret1-like [Aricia agestis]
MGILKQVLCTFMISTTCINFGLMFAWPSSTVKLFESTNTTLNRPMTETEVALFGSLSSCTALISTPISGFVVDYVGRKYTSVIFSLPQVIAWIVVAVSRRVELVLVAMSISGISGCLFNVTPVFISEICHEKIRGTMTACSIIFYGIGILLSYLIGGWLSYGGMIYTCLTCSITQVLLLSLVKESPTYLMKKGQDKEAARNIAFYRGTKPESKEVLEAMALIHKTLNPEMDDDAPENEKLQGDGKPREKLTLFQFIKKSKSTRQGLMVVTALYTFAIFQGLVVAQVYAEPLFREAMPNVSSNITSIAFAVVNTIVGFVAAYLTDLTGRRPLMIYSSFATGISCVALGTQIQLHWGPFWVTAVFLYAFCIFYTAGAGTVPYVVISELFLPEVRGVMTMAASEWAWICNFIILFIFNPLVEAIGLGCVFYLFGAICFASAVFSFIYMPETKELTVDVIQTLLVRKKQY